MQARYYDPVIGRFYSNDPVGTIGHFSKGNIHGFNRFAYANNNPYKYTDPDGKFALPLLLTPPALAAMGKAAAFVGSAIAAAWTGSEAINALNESSESNSQNGKGKKAKDSGKNSKHGKNGQAGRGDKAQDQVADLEKQLEGATGKKETTKIKQKLKNIKKNNDSKNKGEEHGKRNKKQG